MNGHIQTCFQKRLDYVLKICSLYGFNNQHHRGSLCVHFKKIEDLHLDNWLHILMSFENSEEHDCDIIGVDMIIISY